MARKKQPQSRAWMNWPEKHAGLGTWVAALLGLVSLVLTVVLREGTRYADPVKPQDGPPLVRVVDVPPRVRTGGFGFLDGGFGFVPSPSFPR
jgi:hypothetical protein